MRENRCPGTIDLLSGKMVDCSKAPTLREIALGRRIRKRGFAKIDECSDDVNEKMCGPQADNFLPFESYGVSLGLKIELMKDKPFVLIENSIP